MAREEYHKSYTQRLMNLQLKKDLLRPIDMLNIMIEAISTQDVAVLRKILGMITFFMLSKGAFGVHVSDEEAYYDLIDLIMDAYLAQHDEITPEQFVKILKEENASSKQYIMDLLK